MRCTPVVNAEQHYPLYAGYYCRNIFFSVGHSVIQNYSLENKPVKISELNYTFTSVDIAKLNNSLYDIRYKRTAP